MNKPKEEIMEATRKALTSHSYADLSIQNIADEFDKSKSLLYHHYDGKDEILLDFLDYILEDFEQKALSCDCTGDTEEFRATAFMAFRMPKGNDFLKTLIELKTQALRDDRYREKFRKFEKSYRQLLEQLLTPRTPETLEKNEIRKISDFILAVNNEAMYRKSTGQETETLEEELEKYLTEIHNQKHQKN